MRDDLRMTLNTTLSADASLEIGGVEETVIIAGSPVPGGDVTTTITAVNPTREELLEDVPNARDIRVAMAQAPGFQMEAYDVGRVAHRHPDPASRRSASATSTAPCSRASTSPRGRRGTPAASTTAASRTFQLRRRVTVQLPTAGPGGLALDGRVASVGDDPDPSRAAMLTTPIGAAPRCWRWSEPRGCDFTFSEISAPEAIPNPLWTKPLRGRR